MSVLAISAPQITVASAAQFQNETASRNGTIERIGWVSSPSTRSTTDIVWSCVAVLVVCTYKCLHLNIASFEENQAGWHTTKWGKVPYWSEWPLLRKWLRKCKWMAIMIIAPEAGVGIAVMQFMDARQSLKSAQNLFPDMKLTLTHAFYARMGGFALLVKESDEVRLESITAVTSHSSPARTSLDDGNNNGDSPTTIALQSSAIHIPILPLSTMKNTESTEPQYEQNYTSVSVSLPHPVNATRACSPTSRENLRNTTLPLMSFCETRYPIRLLNYCNSVQTAMTGCLIAVFVEHSGTNYQTGEHATEYPVLLNEFPTEDSISDRCKSDAFTKTFAIVQSTWLAAQCIARAAAVSQSLSWN